MFQLNVGVIYLYQILIILYKTSNTRSDTLVNLVSLLRSPSMDERRNHYLAGWRKEFCVYVRVDRDFVNDISNDDKQEKQQKRKTCKKIGWRWNAVFSNFGDFWRENKNMRKKATEKHFLLLHSRYNTFDNTKNTKVGEIITFTMSMRKQMHVHV